MSATLRKSVADVTRRKSRTLMVVLGIFIGVFGLTVINVTQDTIFSAYTFNQGINADRPDLTLNVDKLDDSLLPQLAAVANVKSLEYQTIFVTQWRISTAPGHVDFAINSFPDLQHIPINPPQLTSGRYANTPGEITMSYGDLSFQPFNIGDTVTVDGAHGQAKLQVVGFMRISGENKPFGFMTDAGLAQLADTDAIHLINIRVNDNAQQRSTAATFTQMLAADHITVLRADSPSQPSISQDQLSGIFTLLRILAILAVIISGLLILNTVTTLVAEQTAIIGTIKAIGGSRNAIMRGYLLSVLIYSLLATLPAIAIGLLAGYQLAASLSATIPLAVGPFAAAPWIIVLSLLIGFGVPLLAAILPLWNGTRISVRDALAAYGVSAEQGSGPLTHLRRRLTWLSQTTWLGLHGTFRKRWRVTLTLLTLIIAGVGFLVVQTATASVNYTVAESYGTVNADMYVTFRGSPTYTQTQSQLTALPNVARIEPYRAIHLTTQWGDLQIIGVTTDTQLYHTQLLSGRWFQPGDTNVMLLSDSAAAHTGLTIGSAMTLANQSLTVIGIIKQPVDVLGWIGSSVLPLDTLNQINQPPAIFQQYIVQAKDRSPSAIDQLANQIDRIINPSTTPVAGQKLSFDNSVETAQSYTARRQQTWYVLYALLYGVALVVSAAGIMGLAATLTASVLERRREIGMMRAMGASARQVAQVFWVEGLALGSIAWCAAALLGLPLAFAFVQAFSGMVLPTDFIVDPIAFVVMLVAVLVIAVIASIVPALRATRLRVAETLRYE